MLIFSDAESLQAQISVWRDAGERIAFVPTMGNLHEGHLCLVDEARRRGDRCVVSIFVNPTQFGPNEDYASYPRTENEDAGRLADRNVDVLFLPAVDVIYPQGEHIDAACVPPASLADILCGLARPGHFAGVATVVKRLFDLVRPDIAIFGEKDYQQLQVIRWLVAEHDLDVEIVGMPTVRETNGLAMSSRNCYLSEAERRRAGLLYTTLQGLCERLQSQPPVDAAGFRGLTEQATEQLAQAGFEPDYVDIRSSDLGEPHTTTAWVILAAARLGEARLIDNLRCNRDK